MEMNNRKIIVVDDEAPIRDMLKMTLNRVGYEVSTATCAGDKGSKPQCKVYRDFRWRPVRGWCGI